MPQLWGAMIADAPERIPLVRAGLATLDVPALDVPSHLNVQQAQDSMAALHLDTEQVGPPHTRASINRSCAVVSPQESSLPGKQTITRRVHAQFRCGGVAPHFCCCDRHFSVCRTYVNLQQQALRHGMRAGRAGGGNMCAA